MDLSLNMNKKMIKEHLIYFSWLYVITLIFSIALWLWVLPAKTKIKASEKVGVFVGIKTIDDIALKEKIMNNDQELLDTIIYYQDVDNYYFTSYLQSAGKQSSDFFILPSSISNDLIQTLCISFTPDEWSAEFNNVTDFKKIDEKAYGILLNKNDESLNKIFSFDDEKDEDYYLFINRKSNNFKGFYEPNNKQIKTDHALKAIHTIIDN